MYKRQLCNFAAVTEFDAKVSASTDPSGSPPTANPVILPFPLIVTGIRLSPHHIYTIVQELPDGTVTAIPALIAIGPALIAFLPEVT